MTLKLVRSGFFCTQKKEVSEVLPLFEAFFPAVEGDCNMDRGFFLEMTQALGLIDSGIERLRLGSSAEPQSAQPESVSRVMAARAYSEAKTRVKPARFYPQGASRRFFVVMSVSSRSRFTPRRCASDAVCTSGSLRLTSSSHA